MTISYARIAKKAFDAKRLDLAMALLSHEVRSGEQVPLLLEMKNNDQALAKAVESGDADLVFSVLMQLFPKNAPVSTLSDVMHKMPFEQKQQLANLLRSFPVAATLLTAYYEIVNPDYIPVVLNDLMAAVPAQRVMQMVNEGCRALSAADTVADFSVRANAALDIWKDVSMFDRLDIAKEFYGKTIKDYRVYVEFLNRSYPNAYLRSVIDANPYAFDHGSIHI